MRKVLSLLALLAAVPLVRAQSTAVRLIIGEGHKVYAKPAFGNYCMGVGVDRSFNDKLTVGFDVGFDVFNSLLGEGRSVVPQLDGVTGSVVPHLLSLNYHTEYALGDDGGTHAYIGTFIGLRRIKQDWTLYDARYDVYKEHRFTTSRMLVPIGLRMGLRGATDGGFMDLYMAVGYQIGGGKAISKDQRLKGAAFSETSALAFSLGLAYGLGW